MKTTERRKKDEQRGKEKKKTKSWTFLRQPWRNKQEKEAACLPCRFFNIVKIHSEITERREKKLWRKMVTVSCQTIWYGLIKKGFYFFSSSRFVSKKYRLFISFLALSLSLRPKKKTRKLSNFQKNVEKMIWT